ncbi:MAG TPA: DUF86 domain-containing protein [Aggregatilineaceae bacterium]|nr:DUF86 domain-containing protein [Aggregatilineaceae bacterium]
MLPDLTHLLDILNAAQRVLNFAENADRQTVEQDVMRQYAILHGITIIGEATRRVSDAFRAAHPEIPWNKMAGMRNRLVHNYNEVDLDVVWSVIQNDIPELIRLIEPLIPPDDAS